MADVTTLGQAGVSGTGPGLFDQPTDVVVAANGDIFVTDSHRNGLNNRIVKFAKNGTFVKTWGRKGAGPGEFSEPHTIASVDGMFRSPALDQDDSYSFTFNRSGVFKYICSIHPKMRATITVK